MCTHVQALLHFCFLVSFKDSWAMSNDYYTLPLVAGWPWISDVEDVAMIFTTHATLLGRYLCAINIVCVQK